MTTNVRHKYLDIEPYRRRVLIVVGEYKPVDAWLKRKYTVGIPEDIKEAWGAVWRIENKKNGQSFSILWTKNIKGEMYSNVTHEVFHLTKSVMEMSEIPLSDATNETWAYLNGWLNEQILNFVLKQ